MAYKILEKNGVLNENIDGAAFNKFCFHRKNGIVPSVLNECAVQSSSNILTLETGLFAVQGFRVKITEAISWGMLSSDKTGEYRLVFEIRLYSDRSVEGTFFTQPLTVPLITEDILRSEAGSYQIEIARFVWDGSSILSLKRTLYVLSTESGGSVHISQELGDSEEATVSQKVITENLNTKLDKWTGQAGNYRLYGVDANGQTQKMYNTSGYNYPAFIAMFGGATGGTANNGGYLTTSDPVNLYHAANKNYVDNADNALANRVSIIEKAAEGKIYDFVADSTSAYKKAVPSTALSYATIDKLGGAMYYGDLLVAAPVTAIENHGKNLFDESAVTEAANSQLEQPTTYGVVENGYLKALHGLYNTLVVWIPFKMNLSVGKYAVSADVYVGNAPNLKGQFGLSQGKGSTNQKTKSFECSAYGVWERKSVTVGVTEAGEYYFCGCGTGGASNYNNLDVRFKNIQVEKADSATTFSPYRDPVTVFEVPQSIRNLAGYGIGISDTVNNYIDFERKLFVRMCAQRMWQEGDEENTEILTDAIISVYPLDVVETVDISASLTFDGEIEVEANGAIVAVNEYGAAIPSTITYQVKL